MYVYVCVFVWVCEYVGTGALRVLKRLLDLLELELELVVSNPHGCWEPNGCSASAVGALLSWATAPGRPAPHCSVSLSSVLGVFSHTPRILLSQLHSQTTFQHHPHCNLLKLLLRMCVCACISTLLSPFRVGLMQLCSGLATGSGCPMQELIPEGNRLSPLSSHWPPALFLGVGPCGTSPACTGLSTGVLMLVLFR